MTKVQKTTILNIDGTPHAVNSLSETIQKMVETYDEWNQEEADIADKMLMVRHAKESLQRQIIIQFRKENADSAQEEQTEDTSKPSSEEDTTNKETQ